MCIFIDYSGVAGGLKIAISKMTDSIGGAITLSVVGSSLVGKDKIIS
jgi:hypothetical protein